jgi:hypothetical protein
MQMWSKDFPVEQQGRERERRRRRRRRRRRLECICLLAFNHEASTQSVQGSCWGQTAIEPPYLASFPKCIFDPRCICSFLFGK